MARPYHNLFPITLSGGGLELVGVAEMTQSVFAPIHLEFGQDNFTLRCTSDGGSIADMEGSSLEYSAEHNYW